MFTQGRKILVAALALAVLGAGPAMAKPGGAGPGATADIEQLMQDVLDIQTLTPGGVTGCADGFIAKSDGSNNWTCQPDDDTLGDVTGCTSGQVAKSDGSEGWGCADDTDTNDGDTLGDVTGCTSGQVVKSDGSEGWGCADDTDTNDGDTLGDVTGCTSGQVAKSDGSEGWDCADDDTGGGGGGGSSFTLTDSDGSPVAVGTVIGIDVGHPVTVITALTFADIPLILMSGEKILLPVVSGDFADIGVVFWTSTGCTGDPWVRASAGYLDNILPAAVVGGVLYVANETAVTSSKEFMSDEGEGIACFDITQTISNVVETNNEGPLSALFTSPIVLGGGP